MRTKYFSLLLFLLIKSQISLAQTNTWYVFPNSIPEVANRYIYVDDNDVKWIGGYNNGLHKFKNGTWTHYMTGNSGIADGDVRESCFDTLGNLWITTWNKLSKYSTSTNTWTTYNVTGQSLDILYSVEVDQQNRVWVGTDGGSSADDGLYMFDGSNWTFYNPTNSALTSRWIMNLKKDASGKIWGCGKGLFEINGTTIVNHPLTAGGFPFAAGATCVDFDSFDNKWVGAYSGGVGKFDGSNWTIYTTANSPLPEDKIWSIAVDQDNVVWIGTETAGLVKFDGVNWTIYNTSNSAITNNRIDALSVDKLNNLWIAPSYGGMLVHNKNGLSGISGQVYYDKNNNSIKDFQEPFLPNQLISINNGAFTAITNSAGNYMCPVVTSGNYTAKVARNNPYIIDTNPDSINFSIVPSAVSLSNKNFGIRLQPNVHDISIDYTALTSPRPGFSYVAQLNISNIGSVNSDSIQVKLMPDTNLILDSTSFAFQLHQGDSIVWRIDSLSIFEQKAIKLYFHLPPNVALLGTSLVSRAAVVVAQPDSNWANNQVVHSDLVVGAYDPNDKLNEPKGLGTNGAIAQNTTELTYTIRFQNTGNAAAINIVLKDTLSANLDWSTFTMLSASHNYAVSMKGNGIVHWNFKNIFLPDSGANEAGSHGYVKYKIKLKQNLPLTTQIKNTAYIYFDFNPAIVTNQVVNTIDNFTNIISDNAIGNDQLIVLKPNPANDRILVEIQPEINKSFSLRIFNASGNLVYAKENQTGQEIAINLKEIPAGIYFLQLNGEEIFVQKKFFKIN